MGRLRAGHLLASNFNDHQNLQGTGTTIVDMAPNGAVSTFAQIDPAKLPGRCPGGVGLTTALVVLNTGTVIVGSLPTTDGTAATAKAGCLIVLDSDGTPVETFAGSGLDGLWDMTSFEFGSQAVLFVSNVLNVTVGAGGQVVHGGTVLRLYLSDAPGRKPHLEFPTIVASGLPERTDPAALVIGPTGLGLGQPFFGFPQALYVADTLGDRVAIVPNRSAASRRSARGRL